MKKSLKRASKLATTFLKANKKPLNTIENEKVFLGETKKDARSSQHVSVERHLFEERKKVNVFRVGKIHFFPFFADQKTE